MLATPRKYALPTLAAGMFAFAVFHAVTAQQSAPPRPPPVAPVASPFPGALSASGLVEPRTENISVGPAWPGAVREVYVRVGQRVQAGTPLFRLDDRHLLAQLEVQEANLSVALAQLARLDAQPRPEELPPSEAKVRAAEAQAALLLDRHQRIRNLWARGTATQEEFRQSELAHEAARQQFEQARTENILLKAGAWVPDKAITRATAAQARAVIAQTKVEIDRALARAPADGEILQMNIRAGEYVSTFQLTTAPIVLGDIRRLHVRADVDEHDIPRFRPDARARAVVRGDPQTFHPLTFIRVEPFVIPKKVLTGDNTERIDTRVLQVIYAIDGTTAVYVGQQVDVFIEDKSQAADHDDPPPS